MCPRLSWWRGASGRNDFVGNGTVFLRRCCLCLVVMLLFTGNTEFDCCKGGPSAAWFSFTWSTLKILYVHWSTSVAATHFNSATVPLKASLRSQIDRCMLDSVSLWCISRREGDFWDVSCINSPQKCIAGLNWPLQCQLGSLFYWLRASTFFAHKSASLRWSFSSLDLRWQYKKVRRNVKNNECWHQSKPASSDLLFF